VALSPPEPRVARPPSLHEKLVEKKARAMTCTTRKGIGDLQVAPGKPELPWETLAEPDAKMVMNRLASDWYAVAPPSRFCHAENGVALGGATLAPAPN